MQLEYSTLAFDLCAYEHYGKCTGLSDQAIRKLSLDLSNSSGEVSLSHQVAFGQDNLNGRQFSFLGLKEEFAVCERIGLLWVLSADLVYRKDNNDSKRTFLAD